VVRREYNANGTLRSETQRIRGYAGLDTVAHVYPLAYEYDLNGRRARMWHPESLGGGETRYGYDSISGALSLVIAQQSLYSYEYDEAGRVRRRIRGPVREIHHYDALGRLLQRVDTVGTEPKHNDVFTYNPRSGKISTVATKTGMVTLGYDGMGALVYSDEESVLGKGSRKVETRANDAMGNALRTEMYSPARTGDDPLRDIGLGDAPRQFRGDRAGGDDGGAEVPRLDRLAQPLRDDAHGVLRGRVDHAGRTDPVAGDRRDVDEVPGLLPLHVRQRGSDSVRTPLMLTSIIRS